MRSILTGILVLVLSASLSALADPDLPLFRHPPFDEAFARVYVQGEGVAHAAVHDGGEFSVHASATDPEDRAAITGNWEITWEKEGNNNESTAQATFRLTHLSGADGLQWWGQLCCNTVATPYVILPTGQRRNGPSMRLDGTPVPRASAQLLAALQLLEGRGWIAEETWEAAEKLRVAPEEERSPALLGLLQSLDKELALVSVLDALTELGYLREQEVRFSFDPTDKGTYAIGLALECWACPQRPGTNIAWSLGRLQEVALTTQ